MKTHYSRIISSSILVLAFATAAQAGSIAYHGVAGIKTAYSRTQTAQGDGVLHLEDSYVLSRPGPPYQHLSTTEASSTVSPGADLFRLRASTPIGNAGGLFEWPFNSASAGAAWRDIIFLDSSPAAITLQVRVEGSFSTSIGNSGAADRIANASMAFAIQSTIVDDDLFPALIFGGIRLGGQADVGQSVSPGGDNFYAREWKSYSIDGGNFVGIYEKRIEFNSTHGGYAFTTAANVYTSGWGPMSASADFGNTFTIAGVYDDNGNLIDPDLIRFDSGMSLVAVPEPASLGMASLAAILLAGFSLRGKRPRP